MYTRKDLVLALLQVAGAAAAMAFLAPMMVTYWNDAITFLMLLFFQFCLGSMILFGVFNAKHIREMVTRDQAQVAFLSMNYSQRRELIDLTPQSGLLDLFEDNDVSQQSTVELNAELQVRYSNNEAAVAAARCEVR